MPKTQELREKAKKLSADIRSQKAEYDKRSEAKQPLWPDQTRTAWDNVNKELNETIAAITEAEHADEMEARMNQLNEWEKRSQVDPIGLNDEFPGGRGETFGDRGYESRDHARQFAREEVDRRNVMRTYILSENHQHLITDEMRNSADRLNYRDSKVLRIPLLRSEHFKALRASRQGMPGSMLGVNMRTMTKTGVGSGSELVPTTFLETLEIAMLAVSPLYLHCEVIRTTTGEKIAWPTADDTSNEGAQVGEVDDISAIDPSPDVTLARLELGAWDFTSKMVKVSNSLSVDGVPNVDVMVAELLGERLGRIKNRRVTLGNGTTQPQGVITAAVVGRIATLATAISNADIVRLQHAVNPAYRSNGQFMAHDDIIATLRLLNDSNGRPLWSSGLQDGVPDRLSGQPQFYNQHMAATVAANNITMAYGDFSKMKIREVGEITIHRLTERYAEQMMTAFMGHQRMDSRLQKWGTDATCPIKKLQQAAS